MIDIQGFHVKTQDGWKDITELQVYLKDKSGSRELTSEEAVKELNGLFYVRNNTTIRKVGEEGYLFILWEGGAKVI